MSHHLTPLATRQRFALTQEEIMEGINWVAHSYPKASLAILSTCNRTEFYAQDLSPNILLEWWAAQKKAPLITLQKECYCYRDQDMLEHLYHVACGLKSMIIGEHQILGQLKDTFNLSAKYGLLKNPFHRLFEHCFYTAKAIRARYSQGLLGQSLGQKVNILLKENHIKNVLVVGAGQTARHILHHLQPHSFNINICNRTAKNAQNLADLFNCRWSVLDELPLQLNGAEAVVIATSSSVPLLQADHFQKHPGAILIDLSVPANTGECLMSLPHIKLFRIDAFVSTQTSDQERGVREAQLDLKRAIDDFKRWQHRYDRREVVKNYRQSMLEVRKKLEVRALRQLSQGADPSEVIQEFGYKLTQKLLHNPSIALKHQEV